MKILIMIIMLCLMGCGIPDYECRYGDTTEDKEVIMRCSEVE